MNEQLDIMLERIRGMSDQDRGEMLGQVAEATRSFLNGSLQGDTFVVETLIETDRGEDGLGTLALSIGLTIGYIEKIEDETQRNRELQALGYSTIGELREVFTQALDSYQPRIRGRLVSTLLST